ncbi:MAG: hypothetical protein KGS60_04150 [Verrucomicrobia bacterium]|jgi:hypothetical protein|nr:hypothetical protein [Verrucomicrobiota bacterium]
MKKPDLDRLLEAWQDGEPAEAEAGELTRALEDPEARARLRQIWFLESGLGEALRTAAVRQTAPRLVSPADSGVGWLQLWAGVALRTVGAAGVLALAVVVAGTGRNEVPDHAEPLFIARFILQNQLE